MSDFVRGAEAMRDALLQRVDWHGSTADLIRDEPVPADDAPKRLVGRYTDQQLVDLEHRSPAWWGASTSVPLELIAEIRRLRVELDEARKAAGEARR